MMQLPTNVALILCFLRPEEPLFLFMLALVSSSCTVYCCLYHCPVWSGEGPYNHIYSNTHGARHLLIFIYPWQWGVIPGASTPHRTVQQVCTVGAASAATENTLPLPAIVVIGASQRHHGGIEPHSPSSGQIIYPCTTRMPWKLGFSGSPLTDLPWLSFLFHTGL